MIYIFLNGYLPTISTRLGARLSYDLGHQLDGYPMESRIPQGLKKPQKMLFCLFHTYMALPRALPSSPPRGRGGGRGWPLCGASSSSTRSSNLRVTSTRTTHVCHIHTHDACVSHPHTRRVCHIHTHDVCVSHPHTRHVCVTSTHPCQQCVLSH